MGWESTSQSRVSESLPLAKVCVPAPGTASRSTLPRLRLLPSALSVTSKACRSQITVLLSRVRVCPADSLFFVTNRSSPSFSAAAAPSMLKPFTSSESRCRS